MTDKTTLKYKGYLGLPQVDAEAGVIRGHVVNVKDTITFQGKTVEEARTAFQESVDDYLVFCNELGREPEKPFSGKMLIRITPEVHRRLNLVAQAKGVSLNRLVLVELKRITRKAYRELDFTPNPALGGRTTPGQPRTPVVTKPKTAKSTTPKPDPAESPKSKSGRSKVKAK